MASQATVSAEKSVGDVELEEGEQETKRESAPSSQKRLQASPRLAGGKNNAREGDYAMYAETRNDTSPGNRERFSPLPQDVNGDSSAGHAPSKDGLGQRESPIQDTAVSLDNEAVESPMKHRGSEIGSPESARRDGDINDEKDGANETSSRSHWYSDPVASAARTLHKSMMGPDEAGDVVICVRKGASFEMQQEIVAALLAKRMLLKIRHLKGLREYAKTEAEDEYVECDCGVCKCRESHLCCLLNYVRCLTCGLTPRCLTQHSIATADVGLVIFVSASPERLAEENLFLKRARWERSKTLSALQFEDTRVNSSQLLTPAERSQLLLRIISSAETVNTKTVVPKHPAILSITTLHDPAFLNDFFKWTPDEIQWSGKTIKFQSAPLLVQAWTYANQVFNGSLLVRELRPITRATLDSDRPVQQEQNFVHELRAQYGEKIAFVFAYNRFFLRALYILVPAGVVVLIIGMYDVRAMHQASLILGLFTSIIWSSIFLSYWDRTAAEYSYMWKMGSETFEEADFPNLYFRGERVTDPITKQTTLYYPEWKRWGVRLLRYLLVVVFYVVWTFLGDWVIMVFITLRSYHDHAMWIFINSCKDAVHGILMAGLGVAIFRGITVGLVDVENYPTEAQRESSIVHTFFALDFWNMFMLLFLISLVYFPLKSGGLFTSAILTEGEPLNQLWESFYGSQPNLNMTSAIQTRHDAEKLSIVMIGPVLICRFFMTFFMSVLPYCLQRRRRANIRRGLGERAANLKEWFSNVRFTFVKPKGLEASETSDSPTFHRARKSMAIAAAGIFGSIGSTATDVMSGVRRLKSRASRSMSFSLSPQQRMTSPPRPKEDIASGDGNVSNESALPGEEEGTSINPQKAAKSMQERLQRPLHVSTKRPLSTSGESDTVSNFEQDLRSRLDAIRILQQYSQHFRARKVVFERRMALKTADHLVEECGLMEYDTFFVYNDLIMQFSLVTFFICVAPWIPLVMCCTNMIECRIRAATLAYAARPPVPRKATNIGPWLDCLRVASWLAIPINALVMMVSMGLLDSLVDCPGESKNQYLDPAMYTVWLNIISLATFKINKNAAPPSAPLCVSYKDKIIFFACVCFGGFAIKILISKFVPQRPGWVDMEFKRRDYAFKQKFLRKHPKRGPLGSMMLERLMDKAWAMIETAKYSRRGSCVRGDWSVDGIEGFVGKDKESIEMVSGDRREGVKGVKVAVGSGTFSTAVDKSSASRLKAAEPSSSFSSSPSAPWADARATLDPTSMNEGQSVSGIVTSILDTVHEGKTISEDIGETIQPAQPGKREVIGVGGGGFLSGIPRSTDGGSDSDTDDEVLEAQIRQIQERLHRRRRRG
eukprot:g5104.t1